MDNLFNWKCAEILYNFVMNEYSSEIFAEIHPIAQNFTAISIAIVLFYIKEILPKIVYL